MKIILHVKGIKKGLLLGGGGIWVFWVFLFILVVCFVLFCLFGLGFLKLSTLVIQPHELLDKHSL